ncbi:MAG: hypothetical protein AB7E70_21580 [Hyphomicrobiaceae bacterium]
MTEVSVSVSPAKPVSPQPDAESIAVRVEIRTHSRTTVPLLLPGYRPGSWIGEGAVWRPHRRLGFEGTLGYLTIEPGALIDADGNRVVLKPTNQEPPRRNQDWDDFDPNAAMEPGIDEDDFRFWFGKDRDPAMTWKRVQSMGGNIVWEGFSHRRTGMKQTVFARLTVPADSEIGFMERSWWIHPDSGPQLSEGFRAQCGHIAIYLDRKIRAVRSVSAFPESDIDTNVAIVEKWTGKTWLGATLPSEPVLSKEDAMRYIGEHTFRDNVNQSGAYTRAGNPSAYMLWPIGGGDSRIAKALLEQAKSDFWPRPIWLCNQPEGPQQSREAAFRYLPNPKKRGVVTFHKENPYIGRDPSTAPIEAKLGWDFLTHAHLRADGVDNQHEGLWLLAASHALTGSLWSGVMLEANARRLMLDRNWETARAGNLQWIQNGRGRGRPIEALVEIMASTFDNDLALDAMATIGVWTDLRMQRRAQLGFDRGEAAQWLSRDTSRREQPFFTGYEEAIDALALCRAYSLQRGDIGHHLLREIILQGRIAASSMRTFDGGATWQSGYHVQAMDDGSMGPMIIQAGPDLRFSSIGGLRAYLAASIFAAENYPQHLDPIDGVLIQVAQRAIAYFDSLPIQTPGSASETLFALGQGARGVDAKVMADSVWAAPVEAK